MVSSSFVNSVVEQAVDALFEEISAHIGHVQDPTAQIQKMFVHVYDSDTRELYIMLAAGLASIYGRNKFCVNGLTAEAKTMPKFEKHHMETLFISYQDIQPSGFWHLLDYPPESAFLVLWYQWESISHVQLSSFANQKMFSINF